MKLLKRTLSSQEFYLHPPMAGYVVGKTQEALARKNWTRKTERYKDPKFQGMDRDMDGGTYKGLIVEVLKEFHVRMMCPVTLAGLNPFCPRKNRTRTAFREMVSS